MTSSRAGGDRLTFNTFDGGTYRVQPIDLASPGLWSADLVGLLAQLPR